MNQPRLVHGTKFILNDMVYTIQKRLPNLRVEVYDQHFNDIKIFSYNELSEHHANGSLRFEIKGKNSVMNDNSINTEHDFETLDNLKHKNIAIFRFEVIKPLLDIPYTERNHNHFKRRADEVNSWAYNPKLASENLNNCTYYAKVSKTSIYRWIKYYTESMNDFRSLIPSYHKCGGKNKPRLHPKILELINESIGEIYLKNNRITIKELRSEVILKIDELNKYSIDKLTCPSHSTFARYVSKIPEFELVAKRIGKRIADNQFSPVNNGVNATYPLERVEIDHTPVDVMIINEAGENIGRPYLILAIDKLTRQPVGFSIGISNGVGWPEVMQCINHIMTEKSYIKEMYPFIKNDWNAFGVPKTAVIDNGLEFKNNAMKDACYQLGFALQFCPPKLPKWKGSVERFFGTSNTGLFHTLPGTTRSNPTKLGENENPTKDACIPFSVFLSMVHKWIVDVYSQDLNKGAGGIPSRLWDAAIQEYPVAWPGNISELSILLGKQAHRIITRRGIELNALRYNSLELNKIFIKFSVENSGKHQKFKVKYNPNNIGHISIYDHLFNKKWINIPCTDMDYAENLTEWEHNENKAFARIKYGIVDEIALSRSKLCIREMIEKCIGYTPKHKARVNKVNSSFEISKFLDEKNKEDNLAQKKSLSHISLSDLGYSFQTEIINTFDTSAYLTESSKELNFVEIKEDNSSKTNKNIKSAKKPNVAEKDLENFDINDFTNYSVISSYIGE